MPPHHKDIKTSPTARHGVAKIGSGDVLSRTGAGWSSLQELSPRRYNHAFNPPQQTRTFAQELSLSKDAALCPNQQDYHNIRQERLSNAENTVASLHGNPSSTEVSPIRHSTSMLMRPKPGTVTAASEQLSAYKNQNREVTPPRPVNGHKRVMSDLQVERSLPVGANYFDLAVLGAAELSSPCTPSIRSIANGDSLQEKVSDKASRTAKINNENSGKKHTKDKSTDSFTKVFSSLTFSRKKDGSKSPTPGRPFRSRAKSEIPSCMIRKGGESCSDEFDFNRIWDDELLDDKPLLGRNCDSVLVAGSDQPKLAPRAKQNKFFPRKKDQIDDAVSKAANLNACNVVQLTETPPLPGAKSTRGSVESDTLAVWNDDLLSAETLPGNSVTSNIIHPLKAVKDEAQVLDYRATQNRFFPRKKDLFEKEGKLHKPTRDRVKSEIPVRMMQKPSTSIGFNFNEVWDDGLLVTNPNTGSITHPLKNSLKENSNRNLNLNENLALDSMKCKVTSKKSSHRKVRSMPASEFDKYHSGSINAKSKGKGKLHREMMCSLNDENMEPITLDDSYKLISSRKIKHAATGRPSECPSSPELPNLRTCELDPAMHQVELPLREDVLMCARVSALADSYRVVDQNFDFGSLIGLSRLTLERFAFGSPPPTLGDVDVGRDVTLTTFVPAHRPIIKSLLECADDLILEEFFCFGKEEEHERTEVAIYSSQKRRQFVVCYRGTGDQQVKPVSTKHAKQKDEVGGASVLHTDQPVPINATIKTAYYANNMEQSVFDAINRLASENPFFDAVMTGHSFGSTLASIGAVRYGSLFPMMRVSAVVFGCPRIGGTQFREFANSLPNVKIMRIEHGEDPWVALPEGSKWSHAGHSIVISSNSISEKDSSHASSVSSSKKDSGTAAALAYRFDKNHPVLGGNQHFFGKKHIGKSKTNDHEIISYVYAIQQFSDSGLPWVQSYVGEDGGVLNSGIEERRHLV